MRLHRLSLPRESGAGGMASIEETRQALQVERDRAMELAERSLSAIDSVTSLANFWLTGLSIVIALIALVGFGVVYLGATRAAKKVADNRLASYINSTEAVRYPAGNIRRGEVPDRSQVFCHRPATVPS
jgi:hypothetical protein